MVICTYPFGAQRPKLLALELLSFFPLLTTELVNSTVFCRN